MKHGIKLVTFIFLFSIILDSFLLAEDRIITSPLINLDEIKSSSKSIVYDVKGFFDFNHVTKRL